MVRHEGTPVFVAGPLDGRPYILPTQWHPAPPGNAPPVRHLSLSTAAMLRVDDGRPVRRPAGASPPEIHRNPEQEEARSDRGVARVAEHRAHHDQAGRGHEQRRRPRIAGDPHPRRRRRGAGACVGARRRYSPATVRPKKIQSPNET